MKCPIPLYLATVQLCQTEDDIEEEGEHQLEVLHNLVVVTVTGDPLMQIVAQRC